MSGFDPPTNNFLPSLNVTLLPLARFVPVLGLIALNGDLRAHFERSLGEPAPQHDVGAAAFHHPIGHCAVRVLHVDVNPGVRIDPFHVGDLARQMDRLVLSNSA